MVCEQCNQEKKDDGVCKRHLKAELIRGQIATFIFGAIFASILFYLFGGN